MAKYTVFLKNNATKKVFSFESEDTGGSIYYTFALADMYDTIAAAIGTGEGEYFICPEGTASLEGAEVLDRGVLQIGEIARTDTDTYNTTKTYTQYGG